MDLNDLREFSESTYGPLVISLVSILALSSFVNVRECFRMLVDGFFGLFPLETGTDGSQSTNIFRLAFIVALIFSWSGVFFALSNLAPYQLFYSTSTALILADHNALAHVVCSLSTDGSFSLAASVLGEEIQSSAGGTNNRSLIDTPYKDFRFGKAVFVVLCLSGLVAIFKKELRKVNYASIAISLIIVAGLSLWAMSALSSGVHQAARTVVIDAFSEIPDDRAINQDCLVQVREDLESRRDSEPPRSIAWIELDQPNFTGLVPAQ